MLVSDFMHKKEKTFNPVNMLILDPLFKRDLEYYIKSCYPGFSPEQAHEAAELFCGEYAGYRKTYGITFTEKALIQLFF